MKPALTLLAALLLALVPALHAAEPVTNSIGMKLVRIEAGTFTMGQDGPQTDYDMRKHPGESDRADWDEKPVHTVNISKPFHIGATEVTVEQVRQFDPEYRKGQGLPDEAASGISWHKAFEFCQWLSKKEGRTYRLPTEAEWEYACRAGTKTVFNTGDKLPDGFLPWYTRFGYPKLFPWNFYFPDGTGAPEYLSIGAEGASLKLAGDGFVIPDDVAAAVKKGQPLLRVAQRAPNAWGLYDMHGSLSEWCSDWYGPYEAGERTDPCGRSDGDFRVFRDGPHSMLSRLVRSANRGAWIPESSAGIFGFRVVLGEQPQGPLLPPEPPPKNARNVKQEVARIVMPPQDEPFFSGPKPFVKIPEGSAGPLFSAHNHSPGITECPNGDLLATWFSAVLEGSTELCNAASRLRFGQSEWEEASPFWDGQDINDHAPKLWWDGDHTISHLANGHSENIVRTSTDNGATWSKAQAIYPQGETGNGMIRTREGSLIITHDVGVSLHRSKDNGKSWTSVGARHPNDDVRPGGEGGRHAGIHAPVVERADGRLMTIGRPHPAQVTVFGGKALLSFSSDHGESWTYAASEFPAVTSVQRPVMIRLREGPILLCSFTDQVLEFHKGNRKGMSFRSKDGEFTGYGMFAAVSYDEGKTWPDRRLITPGGPAREVNTINKVMFTLSDTMAEPQGYLAITQTRDNRIQLLTSKNHYVFNLAWIQALPPAPLAAFAQAKPEVVNATKAAKRTWESAPAETKALWQQQREALKHIDLSDDTQRQIIIARGSPEPGAYHAHPTTAMLADGKTIFCVWNIGHGGHAGPMARSDDAGLTWTRMDDALPPNYVNFKNCPSIYRITDPQGKERLWVFAARTLTDNEQPNPIAGRHQGYMPRIVSEDDGKTWRELPPIGGPIAKDDPFRCIMTFSSIVRLKDGGTLGLFHRGSGIGEEGTLQVLQSITRDGGFTWSEPTLACDGMKLDGKHPCEPYVFRSPDGDELCCLMRENRRSGTSLVMFSRDEGRTWSSAVDAPWGLTGDRHHGIQLPDGRLVIVFRNASPQSNDKGGFIAWIGTYDDIKKGKPGQYRVSLLKTFKDGFYPGIHLLPDGTIVATTYANYRKEDVGCSIVSVRFTMSEVEGMVKTASVVTAAATPRRLVSPSSPCHTNAGAIAAHPR